MVDVFTATSTMMRFLLFVATFVASTLFMHASADKRRVSKKLVVKCLFHPMSFFMPMETMEWL